MNFRRQLYTQEPVSQIKKVLDLFIPDIIQLPFSVFDQRLLQDGTLSTLKSLGIEIHARSIFLQGLLLMKVKSCHFER